MQRSLNCCPMGNDAPGWPFRHYAYRCSSVCRQTQCTTFANNGSWLDDLHQHSMCAFHLSLAGNENEEWRLTHLTWLAPLDDLFSRCKVNAVHTLVQSGQEILIAFFEDGDLQGLVHELLQSSPNQVRVCQCLEEPGVAQVLVQSLQEDPPGDGEADAHALSNHCLLVRPQGSQHHCISPDIASTVMKPAQLAIGIGRSIH
mmetsp:Transcript_50577/g.120255  ORF Transcript_50577/g.120255 Transcript_50577/m.120255 type:complete len:201 (-) Transcript_50577:3346-3948(-)